MVSPKRVSTVHVALMLGVSGLLSVEAPAALITAEAGSGAPHANRQPSLGIHHIIALEGIFPSRNFSADDPSTAGVGGTPLIGGIGLFAGNFAPRGWAFADGQLLPISQYTALFSILGTTYGGDGRTTFALPDLRGRTAMQPRTGPGLTPRTLGQKLGVENVRLTQSEMPSHRHTLPSPNGMSDPNGGGAPHTNMQPSLGVNYVIALDGTFPTRNVAADDPVSAGLSASPLIGGVGLFAGNFAPRGWAFADGQLLSVSQHPALFSVLGTTYGGDGRTTFALPDLRGRVPIQPRSGPGLTTRSLGEKVGVEEVVLTESQLPMHSHAVDWPCGSETGATGGGQPHANMQPSLGLNYVIAISGTFPSRNATADGSWAAGLSAEPMLGEVALFAGNFAPRGWAFADGQLLPISGNEALFSILGTTYGGDGRTTFALPDLRGRTAVHPGTGPGLTTWQLGQRAGVEEVTLAESQMPAHSHTAFTVSLPGDMNFDGNVDFDDIAPFQLGLTAPQDYEALYCVPSSFNGDMDQDGDHDFDDIAGFVMAINAARDGSALAVPEPASWTLICLALLNLAMLRRR